MELFEMAAPTRQRRKENENRSEALVIGNVAVLMNDNQLYIRRDMNADCSLELLLMTMYQIRRSIQIGCKQRQRMTIFVSETDVTMFYAPHFERNSIREILIERLHAQKD